MRNSCIAKGSGSLRVRYAASLVATIVAAVLMGCSESPSMMSTVSSPVIPFDTLFQLEDTIRLDPKILIGNIGFMDVDECLPDDAGIFPLVARSMGRGRTLVVLASKSAAIFTADGKCLAGKRALFPYPKSYCVQGDTIVTHNLYTGDRPEAGVFTSALKALPGIAIAPPRFVVLDYTYAGQLGRTIECFHDGPYYIYNESMDAIPVHRADSILRHRPAFFTERPKDLPIGSISKRAKARAEHPSAIGVFALDGQTRMVVYVDLESSWKHYYAGMPLKIGLSVASNTGAFPGRSTVAPVWPIAAANGFLYAVGENGNLPSGDVGNPFVVRYRHTPPKMGVDLARGR